MKKQGNLPEAKKLFLKQPNRNVINKKHSIRNDEGRIQHGKESVNMKIAQYKVFN